MERQQPPARTINSPWDAQLAARDWLRFIGFVDAVEGPRGADSGIDVVSSATVAQVKAYSKAKVGRPDIQRIKGVAETEDKTPVFFSLSGYSEPAITWALDAEVALFGLTPDGKGYAVNTIAYQLTDRGGTPEPPWSAVRAELMSARMRREFVVVRGVALNPRVSAGFSVSYIPRTGVIQVTASAASDERHSAEAALAESPSWLGQNALRVLAGRSMRPRSMRRRRLERVVAAEREAELFQPLDHAVSTADDAISLLDELLAQGELTVRDFAFETDRTAPLPP